MAGTTRYCGEKGLKKPRMRKGMKAQRGCIGAPHQDNLKRRQGEETVIWSSKNRHSVKLL
jgi:hypothetical protein